MDGALLESLAAKATYGSNQTCEMPTSRPAMSLARKQYVAWVFMELVDGVSFIASEIGSRSL